MSELELSGEIYQPVGLENGGHVIMECSNCGIPLVDVHITQPNLDYRWRFKAKCCHCGDGSFITKINGGIYLGSTEKTIPGSYYEVEENGIRYMLIETEKA